MSWRTSDERNCLWPTERAKKNRELADGFQRREHACGVCHGTPVRSILCGVDFPIDRSTIAFVATLAGMPLTFVGYWRLMRAAHLRVFSSHAVMPVSVIILLGLAATAQYSVIQNERPRHLTDHQQIVLLKALKPLSPGTLNIVRGDGEECADYFQDFIEVFIAAGWTIGLQAPAGTAVELPRDGKLAVSVVRESVLTPFKAALGKADIAATTTLGSSFEGSMLGSPEDSNTIDILVGYKQARR